MRYAGNSKRFTNLFLFWTWLRNIEGIKLEEFCTVWDMMQTVVFKAQEFNLITLQPLLSELLQSITASRYLHTHKRSLSGKCKQSLSCLCSKLFSYHDLSAITCFILSEHLFISCLLRVCLNGVLVLSRCDGVKSFLSFAVCWIFRFALRKRVCNKDISVSCC